MQFSGKFGVFTPPLEGSHPPSGKSWIRHCEPVPEPDQQESPTSETVSEVVEDITEQPHEPEVILLSDSDISDSETISLKTDTTLGKFPENSLIYSLS